MPTPDYSEFQAEVTPNQDALARLGVLGQELVEAQEEADRLAAEAKALQRRIDTLTIRDIPQVMDEIGMEKFTLSNGYEVTVERKISASISEARRGVCHAFLREHGEGKSIKNQFKLDFRMGEEEKAAAFVRLLEDAGLRQRASQKEFVESSTLGRIVRELIEDGVPFDQDAFGVYDRKVAKIKGNQNK